MRSFNNFNFMRFCFNFALLSVFFSLMPNTAFAADPSSRTANSQSVYRCKAPTWYKPQFERIQGLGGSVREQFFDYAKLFITGERQNNSWYDLFSSSPAPAWGSGRYLCNGVSKRESFFLFPVPAKSVTLEDYDFNSGVSTCRYVLEDDSVRTCKSLPNRSLTKTLTYITSFEGTQLVDGEVGLFSGATNAYYSDARFFNMIGGVLGIPLRGQDYARGMLNNPNTEIDVRSMARSIGLMHESNGTRIETRFSNFFTGLLLLDDTYVKGVDPTTGNIILTDETNSLAFTDLAKNTIESEESDDDAYVLDASLVNSFSRVFDRQAFGLYVNFFDFFMKAFQYFAYIMLVVSATWFGGTFLAKKGIEFVFKNKGQETDYQLKLSGLALSFALLFMPIPGGVRSSETDTSGSQATIDTTVAKGFINFFAQYGADFANYMSDGVFVTALDYYLKRFGYNTIEKNQTLLRYFKTQIVDAKTKETFYAGNCKYAYNADFGYFQDVSNDNVKQKLYRVNSNYYESAPAKNIFNYDEIFGGIHATENRVRQSFNAVAVDPMLCAKIEKDLQSAALSLPQTKATADTFASHAFDAEQTQAMEHFVQAQLELQKKIGWINMVSLPLLETYVTVNSVFTSAKNASEVYEKTGTIVQNKDQQSLTDEEKKNLKVREMREDDKSLLESGIQIASSMSLYFILPGFDGLYSMISEFVREAWGMIEIVFFSVASFFGNIAGSMFATAMITITSFTGIKALAVMLISLFIAIGVYSVIIKSIFMIMTMLMILIKIFFFFLSLLKYFFITPFAVFLQMRADDKDALKNFLSKGFILVFVKPLLIVISVAVFVITYELLLSLYSLLFSLGSHSVSSLHHILGSSSSMSTATYLGATSMTAMLEPAGKILLDFFSILVAYAILMNGDKWMLSMLGVQEDDHGDVKQVVDDIKAKVGKI